MVTKIEIDVLGKMINELFDYVEENDQVTRIDISRYFDT